MAGARAALEPYELSGIVETGRDVASGSYYSVTEVKYEGISYAAKRRIIHETQSDEIARLIERRFKEYVLHSQLNHPNIVQFVGFYYSTLSGSPLPVLVMELLPTNLANYLARQHVHGPLPNETRCSILRDVAQGLRYLHDRPEPIVHRDLTASNVLLTEDLCAKICDFTRAKTLTPVTRSGAMAPSPGVLYAMPPETMVLDPRYGTEIDIFSFGVLMLYICTGEHHYMYDLLPGDYPDGRSWDIMALTEVECRKRYFDKMSPNHPLWSLINDCLANVPANRPTAMQILSQLQKIILGELVADKPTGSCGGMNNSTTAVVGCLKSSATVGHFAACTICLRGTNRIVSQNKCCYAWLRGEWESLTFQQQANEFFR